MKLKLLSSLMLVASLAQAAAPVEGWYSTAHGGLAAYPSNVNVFVSDLRFNNPRYRLGFEVGGAVGFKTIPLRYEVQYTFTRNHIRNFAIDNIQLLFKNGFSSANFVMFNLYYDFPEIVPAIAPYIGAGLGVANVTTHLNSADHFENFSFNRNATAFAWQATYGLLYNFAENWALGIAYRYAATTTMGAFHKSFQAHFGEASITYRWDEWTYR